ncbi:MAG: hypothetical protein HQ472_08330 [Ignavibacteria bacterium]|nr:hypothetical protein [Ignavibacteria bacterium]
MKNTTAATYVSHFTFPLMLALVFALMFAFCTEAFAQQTQPQQPNRPIELPEFIVTGKQRVDIPGGAKQPPSKPASLRSGQIDSLNPTEKQPIPSLPAHKLPSLSRPLLVFPGYVEAQFGNYLTPTIQAGYSTQTAGYLLDFSGNVEASNGWVDNSDYVKSDVKARSTYIAPSEFIFFGGSSTSILAEYNSTNFALFANPSADRRNYSALKIDLDISGKSNLLKYFAAVGYNAQSLSTANRSSSGNNIFGRASVLQTGAAFQYGVEADARIQSYAGNSYPYSLVGGLARLEQGDVIASAGVGFQWASSTGGQSRPGVSIKAEMQATLDKNFSVIGNFSSGLRPVSFADMYSNSPWVDDSLLIDFSYDVFAIKAALNYHPTVRLFTSAGVKLLQTERDVIFVSTKPGLFAPSYLTSTTMVLFGDVTWMVDESNTVFADVTFTNAALDSGHTKPYVAMVTGSATYQRYWMPKLRSTVSVIYVGDRWSDVQNTNQLSGYIDVRFGIVYDINKNANLFLRAQNLVGSSIVLWNGYQERSTFISGGINWRF